MYYTLGVSFIPQSLITTGQILMRMGIRIYLSSIHSHRTAKLAYTSIYVYIIIYMNVCLTFNDD